MIHLSASTSVVRRDDVESVISTAEVMSCEQLAFDLLALVEDV